MRGDIAEGADAEHAPHLDQIAVARDAAERRDRERHAQEHQRPEAGAVDEVVERARAVRDRAGIVERLTERQQQQDERSDPQRRQTTAFVAPKLPGSAHRSGLGHSHATTLHQPTSEIRNYRASMKFKSRFVTTDQKVGRKKGFRCGTSWRQSIGQKEEQIRSG